VQQTYLEFIKGLNGRPSIESIEKEHGNKWRDWVDPVSKKRRNTKTKTYLQRKVIVDRIRSFIEKGSCEAVAIANVTEEYKLSKKTSVAAFSEYLKGKT
jgi:hypothetical protein